MKHLCASCNVCVGLGIPEQTEPREIGLAFKAPDEDCTILVIDDHDGDKFIPVYTLNAIFGKMSYTYTHTIRCSYDGSMLYKELSDARDRCAVWTKMLLDNRAIILATPIAIRQMGLPVEWEKGKVFNSPALGMVLCINPLSVVGTDLPMYKAKVERMVKMIKTGVEA